MGNPRSYKQTDIKRLFAKSGNRCAHPDCINPICDHEGTLLGKICHIYPIGKDKPRYDSSVSKNKLRNYDNLILLCGNCHDKIDNPELEYKYPAEWLIKAKKEHEQRMSGQMPPLYLQEEFFNVIIEKLLSSLSKLEPDPRLKTYHLQRIVETQKSIPTKIIRKSNQYTIAFLALTIIAIILPIGYLYAEGSYHNFDRVLLVSVILTISASLLAMIATKKGYRYPTILTPFKSPHQETYRWGKFGMCQNNGYLLYDKGFTCGFPGCGGKVKVIRISSPFDLEERYKGICEHNQIGHTYMATRERAWYYDFIPDKILEEMRRIKN